MLLSLTVFMLLVAEIMPATSDSVPLIGEACWRGHGARRSMRQFLLWLRWPVASAPLGTGEGWGWGSSFVVRLSDADMAVFLPRSPSCLLWSQRPQHQRVTVSPEPPSLLRVPLKWEGACSRP